MQVPTREQIAEALRVPKVKPDLDRMGRVKTKNVRSDVVSCLLYTSPSPRDGLLSRMPSSA